MSYSSNIKLDIEYTKDFLPGNLDFLISNLKSAHEFLKIGTGLGNEYLGWRDLPINYDHAELDEICETANEIRNKCEVFIVIGIGGSYLGARAAIEFIYGNNYNLFHKPQIIFAGTNLSSRYLNDILKMIENKEVCLNIISKSGTTLEPSVAFRILRNQMYQKYGESEANKRIYVTTDQNSGLLKQFADSRGYKKFRVPDDIGGRYSVLSPVGLLPMAVAGVDVKNVLDGAYSAYSEFETSDIKNNDCLKYALIRNAIYSQGRHIEILVNYEPSLAIFSEWWKQLFGESEGKHGNGIFPTSLNYTTDLHSMGQYIQEGHRYMFETILNIENSGTDIKIEPIQNAVEVISDGLKFVEGKKLSDLNKAAMNGTIKAHNSGGVPNIIINAPDFSEASIGSLFYFFEKACAVSGYMNSINPFDQPGVEDYKKNMLKILGK